MTAKRIRERVMALFAVAVMLMTCLTATPAFADNTPVNGGTFTFKKYLVMDENANVPPVTFTYTITAGEKVEGSAGQPAITAGIMDGTSAPTVSDATFQATDSTTAGTPVNQQDSGKKYATQTVTVNLSGIQFGKPGIYRYIISETQSGANGIINDQNSVRTLDVFVEYDETMGNGTLKIGGYFLHTGDGVPSSENKSSGFTNTYTTNDLTLEKQVTGNQGDRDKYFKFTVVIFGAAEGTKYSIDLPIDGHGENPSTLTADVNGQATGTFYLKHGQSIVIQGLTSDTTYTITEDDYSTDGYETTNTDNAADGKTTGDKTMPAEDHTVTFTNDKDGVIPTGILLETTPYLVMGGVVVVGLVALVATRRRQAR